MQRAVRALPHALNRVYYFAKRIAKTVGEYAPEPEIKDELEVEA